MARDGQFVGFDAQKVTVQTTKGPWSMFYPKTMGAQLAQIPPGIMVQFECSKPDGKNYWRLDSITPAGAAVASAPTPQPVGAYVLPAAPAATPVGHVDDKEEGMFVMGVVGRSMGSGSFSVNDIPALTNMAVWAWRNRQAINDAEMG